MTIEAQHMANSRPWTRLGSALAAGLAWLFLGCGTAEGSDTEAPTATAAALLADGGGVDDTGAQCGLQPKPQKLGVRWVHDRANGGAISRPRSSPVYAELWSDMAEPVTVTVLLRPETAGKRGPLMLGQYTVPAFATVDVVVNLPMSNTRFSQRADLQAFAQTDSGEHWTIYSEPVYFHEEGSDLLVYNEQLLQDGFNHGALHDSRPLAIPQAFIAHAQRLGRGLRLERRYAHTPLSPAAQAELERLARKADGEP